MAGFKITEAKGFHITFENGFTVSVQFGPGNYGDNYRVWRAPGEPTPTSLQSSCAETAAWDAADNWLKDDEGHEVQGWQTPAQVLALLNKVAALDPALPVPVREAL